MRKLLSRIASKHVSTPNYLRLNHLKTLYGRRSMYSSVKSGYSVSSNQSSISKLYFSDFKNDLKDESPQESQNQSQRIPENEWFQWFRYRKNAFAIFSAAVFVTGSIYFLYPFYTRDELSCDLIKASKAVNTKIINKTNGFVYRNYKEIPELTALRKLANVMKPRKGLSGLTLVVGPRNIGKTIAAYQIYKDIKKENKKAPILYIECGAFLGSMAASINLFTKVKSRHQLAEIINTLRKQMRKSNFSGIPPTIVIEGFDNLRLSHEEITQFIVMFKTMGDRNSCNNANGVL